MKVFKRGLATVLALLMLVMAVPFGGLAVYAAEDYPTIELGVTTDAVMEEDWAYFWFTPAESGWYQFYSMADRDTRAYIYDADGNWLAEDDDSGEDSNFRVICEMKAGVTYKLGARFYSYGDGSFPVCVETYDPRVVTNLVFYDQSYLMYQIEEGYSLEPRYDVYYSDGSVETRTYSDFGDDVGWYYIDVEYNVPTDQWQEGGVYTATYSADVRGTVYEGTYTVTIEECPIVSIEFAPLALVEHYNGYWSTRNVWDEENEQYITEEYYYYYNVYPRATVTMKDGTVHENVESFNWNDSWYGFSVNQYNNPLVKGVNYIDGSLMGFDYTIEIEVIDTPIASIEFEPYSVIENWGGSWHSYCQQDGYEQSCDYFYYDLYPRATVTMKDGTVYEDVTGFEWNNRWYNFSFDQNHHGNHLQLGTNQLSGRVLGYEYTIEIVVEPSPIQSIVFEPCTVIENSEGYWDEGERWDSELEQYVPYKYFYYNDLDLSYTVTMRDGSVYEDHFVYNDSWYNCGFSQNSDRYLTLGNNVMTGSVLGYDYTVEIEVVESPVASVEVDPIVRIQYHNGDWNKDWYYDEQGNRIDVTYFYYYSMSPNSDNVTITLKDGTVINDTSFEWGGQEYYLQYDGQWAQNYLELGVNEWHGSIAGYDFTYTIEIIETPVASVVANPISLIEERDGYWRTSSFWDENDNYIEVSWFCYYSNNIEPRLTITMKDGTVYSNCTGFNWNGTWYGMSVDGQNSDNHLLPGSNTWHGSIAGYEFEYNIEISTLSSNESFEYMENSDSIIITDCYMTDETVEIPAEINGKPVTAVAGLNKAWPYLKNLILPDSVVTIGDYVLSNLDYLQSIHIGAGVSNLNAEMFGYCWQLQSITISEDNPYFCVVNGGLHNKALDTFIAFPMGGENPAYLVPATVVNLEALDYYSIYNSLDVTYAEDHVAFVSIDGVTYNKEMTKVISCRKDKTGDYVMPETVEEIADGAFMNTKLTSVVVSPKVTEIVYCAFASCASLESVVLPDGLISIEQSAFEQTFALESINFPEGLEYIGYYSFYKTGLTDAVIPGSVRTIDSAAFYSSDLVNLTLKEGVKEIWSSAFANTDLTSVVLPNSLTHLGGYAFEDCHALASVRIGSGLTNIDSGAFSNSGLTTVDIPDNITGIYSSAFANCDSLQSAHLGAGVSYIGTCAFAGNSMLTTLTVAKGNKTYFSNGNCVITHDGNLTVGCAGSVIPNDGSVTAIEEYAFYNCGGLEAITLPDSLEYIGERAFANCDSMESIIIPDSVNKIDIYAFSFMDKLSDVKLGDGLEYMAAGAFEGSPVENVDLGNSVPFIAPDCFASTNLRDVFIPSSVTSMMYRSFAWCENLTSIEIPITVETIEEEAFRGCYNLTDVYYQGTEADRDAMYIEEWGNESLLGATWHYEWTNENWTPIPECDHVYDDICDEDCNLCGRPRKAPHEYDNACDEFCNICDAFRPVGDHEYDNGCDAFCNICGNERWIEGHWYDNACDADCNECGAVREAADHWYDNACDATCNECGAVREVADHVYDTKYDPDCNECGAKREIPDPILFSVSNTHARPGDTFTVSVSVDRNSGLCGFRFNVLFDDTRFELIGAEGVGAYAAATFGPMQSPFNVMWVDAIHPEVTDEGVIVVLTFRVKDGAELGESEISIEPFTEDIVDGNLDIIPCETVSGTITLTDGVPGDADGDGVLNMQDLGLLMRYLTGWNVEVDTTALDVNRDGKVNNRDFALIQRHLNGWDVELF